MQNNTPNMQELLRMAQSPAGKQLLQLIQQNNSQQLHNAMVKAASGDFDQAIQILAPLLQNEDTQKLLEQLGRT